MARTKKFIVHPSDDKLGQFPAEVRDLVKKGREHGFVTQQELMKAMPNIEEDLILLDEIYGLFLDLGIEVIDAKDAISFHTEEVEEEEQIVAVKEVKGKKVVAKSIELREIANDSIRLYLCEIGKVSLLTAKEEIDLARRIKKGDQTAKQRLAEANLRLVVSIAKIYWQRAFLSGLNPGG